MTQKFIDRDGLKVLWNQISLKDYPNNETLMAVIDAIDEIKANKDELFSKSWNDLTDKPFYDASTIFLEWDGNTDGMEYVVEITAEGTTPLLYKYSNSVCTKDELLGCTMTMVTEFGEEESIEITENMIIDADDSGKLFAVGMGYVYVVIEDCAITDNEFTIELSQGLWVMSPFLLGGYISYIGKESGIKTLDIKFIPNELYTKIDERIDAYIEEALGGEY